MVLLIGLSVYMKRFHWSTLKSGRLVYRPKNYQ